MYFDALAQKYRFDLHTPIESLPDEAMKVILFGTGGEKLQLRYERGNGRGTLEQAFEGILPNLERRFRETQSDAMRKELEEYMSTSPCPHCRGERLSDIARAVTVGGLSITQFCGLSVSRASWTFWTASGSRGAQAVIAEPILKRDPQPPRLFEECRPAISDAFALGRDALRRRGAAHPSCHADRRVADGRAVYP